MVRNILKSPRKCLDDWKLYVNYKIIKKHLLSKRKNRIFFALKENLNYSKILNKKQKGICHILLSRYLINSLKRNFLKKRSKFYNKRLSYEYMRGNLLQKGFKLIKSEYEKHLKYKKMKNE